MHLGICRTHQIPRPFTGMTVYENVEVGIRFGGRRTVLSGTGKELRESEYVQRSYLGTG